MNKFAHPDNRSASTFWKRNAARLMANGAPKWMVIASQKYAKKLEDAAAKAS